MADSYPDGKYDAQAIVSQQEAKVYSFKSVGVLDVDVKRQFPVIPNEIPIGIKTPIQFGTSNDGLFKMHKKMSGQLSDNFRNMLLTNHGERLGLYDFGANLEELVHELGNVNADSEAIRRISATTKKYMPFIELDTFEAYQSQGEHGLPNRAGIKIGYSVPKLQMRNKSIEIVLWTGHETPSREL